MRTRLVVVAAALLMACALAPVALGADATRFEGADGGVGDVEVVTCCAKARDEPAKAIPAAGRGDDGGGPPIAAAIAVVAVLGTLGGRAALRHAHPRGWRARAS